MRPASRAADATEHVNGLRGRLQSTKQIYEASQVAAERPSHVDSTGTVEGPSKGRLRGQEYEIPGWHDKAVSYTKREPERLSELRAAFDSSVRKGLFKRPRRSS